MNTKALKSKMDWRETGIIKGVKVKQIPIEGCKAYFSIGSDHYGYQIGSVSSDGTQITLKNEDGIQMHECKLITRKNSRYRGRYCIVGYRPEFGCVGLTAEPGCGETELDPSF